MKHQKTIESLKEIIGQRKYNLGDDEKMLAYKAKELGNLSLKIEETKTVIKEYQETLALLEKEANNENE